MLTWIRLAAPRRRARKLPRLMGALAALALVAMQVPAGAQDASGMFVRHSDLRGVPDTQIDLESPSRERYAVVIGNGDYQHATDLDNTVNDARAMARFLRANDYIVVDYYDLEKKAFEAALRRLLVDVSDGADLVFYFAGHGLQIGNGNYLIPTDADIDSIYDVPFETVSLSSLLSIAGSRARSMIVILDSCRNNPFPGQKALVGLDAVPQELETGFTPQDSPINSLVVFATAPGALALDGEGEQSPFTQALIEVASRAPGVPLDGLMKDVRRLVYQRTAGRQVPWESSSLVEPVVVASGTGDFVITPAAVPAAPPTGDPLRISSQLHPKVRLGDDLRSVLPADNSQLMLAAPPRQGRLELDYQGRFRSFPTAGAVHGEAAHGLVYNPTIPEQSAPKMRGLSVVDTFELAVADNLHRVELSLEVDPCDFHAGDHLDPDGVGVARFPNEIEVEEALAACQQAVAAAPEVGRFHYQLGRVHMAMRDLNAAEAAFERARELDHVRAWHALGTVAARRDAEAGGDADLRAPDAALDLFAAGVQRGDPYAFHSLGLQLLEFGRDRDEVRQGFELLSRALELGHTFSMNALGLYFLDEEAPHYDPERGLRYLQESAARGDIYGYANLGFVSLTGAGGQAQDHQAAFDWFRRASDEGHPTAPSSIGRMYNAGQITGAPDYAEAVRWYDLGLERGDAWGGANAAWIIANRRPADYAPHDAAVRAAKAATLRNPEAAESALETLRGLPPQALQAGTQALLVELGEDIAVDGALGTESQEALDRVATRFDTALPSEPIDRLTTLARLVWRTTKFRVDLF